MRQPKTREEFFALPVRSEFDYKVERAANGSTIVRPVARPGYAIAYEDDTIMVGGDKDGMYVLASDAEGLYRKVVAR